MSSEAGEVRRRDSTRTRQALLDAASELFGQHGFQRTTLRDIGDRAGVDPALIARYFGSKTALYVASLENDEPGIEPLADGNRAFVARFIERTRRLGPGPLVHAAVTATDDAEIKEAAARILGARSVAPFEQMAVEAGVDNERLRAELATAALAGIALCRSAGTFTTLGAAEHDDVVELTQAMILSLLTD